MPRLYVALEDTLVVATADDPTTRWTSTTPLTDHRFECVATPDPDEAPATAYAGTFDAGAYRTTDAGETWAPTGRDTLPEAVTALAPSPHDPETVWAGTEPSAVYTTADAGDSWTHQPGLTDLPSAPTWSFPPRPHTHHVRWIQHDPTTPGHTYVGIEAGALVITTDNADTWTDRPPGSRRDNHQLATHPDAPGRVYAAAGDGYAESTDHGSTWTHPQDGLEHRYVWSVAVDPGDPDRVVVSAAQSARAAHYHQAADAHAYYKHDDHWYPVADGLPTGDGVLRAVLTPGAQPGEIYAAHNHGLYRTTNAGRTWHPLDLEFEFDWPDQFTAQTVRGLAHTP